MKNLLRECGPALPYWSFSDLSISLDQGNQKGFSINFYPNKGEGGCELGPPESRKTRIDYGPILLICVC